MTESVPSFYGHTPIQVKEFVIRDINALKKTLRRDSPDYYACQNAAGVIGEMLMYIADLEARIKSVPSLAATLEMPLDESSL